MAMAEARLKHDWSMTAAIMTLTANANRDPKKSRPFRQADFMPPSLREPEPVVKGSIHDLKIFLRQKPGG